MVSSPVCFVNLDSINVTPYFEQYRKCLSCDYDLVYWDRGECDCATGAANVFRYSHRVPEQGLGKALGLARGYLGFRSFASKILRENQYQRIVALTGNAATLLSNVLRRNYRGRYIIDVRDYFMENLAPYRMREEHTIEDAGLAIISSPAYTAFLGEHDFHLMHNVQELSGRDVTEVQAKERPSNPMVLGSIGTAKNLELDRQVIAFFGNDDRFQLLFAGRGYDQLSDFVRERGFNNVEVIGDFPSSRTLEFYRSIDAIMSMYGNEMTHVKYQLTNKLYFAAQLNLPILVSPGSFMDTVVSKYRMGFALNMSDLDAKKNILNLYDATIASSRKAGTERFCARVTHDNERTMRAISDFLHC